MSILASLAKAYERLPNAPPFGYSSEKIGFLLSLKEDGSVAHLIDLRSSNGKKKQAPLMDVPTSFKRPGTTPRPFFLWDNTNYALGASVDIDPDDKRFEVFRARHLVFLENETDIGLSAFHTFLKAWTPSDIDKLISRDELRTAKVAFALESERQTRLLHQRPRAQQLWGEIASDWKAVEGKESAEGACLVTGRFGTITRTHPAIRGIPSKGGKDADSIVSFNFDAVESYGHKQGDNAPVSDYAAFAYTAALNAYLGDKKHRLQIGDASTVFWADAEDAEAALLAEAAFFEFFDPAKEEADTTKDVKILLERLRKGDQELGEELALKASELARKVEKGVRFYVLGLAPNAARISIRFYYESDFGALAKNYQRFVDDMRIEPPWRDPYPPLWRYLVETAVLGKRENVPPNLAGEWTRAILTGTSYPLSLLSSVLSRIRADGEVNALRASILRALLVRNYGMRPNNGDKKREAPVALDPENRNKGYLLGRLFAIYERIQRDALGDKVNATIKDKFYGSASAAPRNVFAALERGSANHLSKIGKEKSWRRDYLEKLVGTVMEAMEPNNDPFPASLNASEQALFGLGYHHQRGEFFRKRESDTGETAQ